MSQTHLNPIRPVFDLWVYNSDLLKCYFLDRVRDSDYAESLANDLRNNGVSVFVFPTFLPPRARVILTYP